MSEGRTVLATDLDGTLAYEIAGGPYDIGPPVPEMLRRVQGWVDEGQEVWILTSRMTAPHSSPELMAETIQDWLEEHGLPRLFVTAEKNWRVRAYYDDRAVAVVPNTGHVVNEEFHPKEEEAPSES